MNLTIKQPYQRRTQKGFKHTSNRVSLMARTLRICVEQWIEKETSDESIVFCFGDFMHSSGKEK